MPGPTPPAVPLSEEERHALHTMIRAHKTPQHLSFRAPVILLLAEGFSAPDVARRLGTPRTTVRRWRRHWLKRPGESVSARLQDAPRPGAPATFGAEPWCQIIALACEPPEASGRPISPWTPRALAAEARQRGIVTTISERHVGRFVKSGRAQAAQKPLLA
jgi:transposase